MARTAAAGAAGAVVLGAAFGLSGGLHSGDDGATTAAPTGTTVDAIFEQRLADASETVSRGLARAEPATATAGFTTPRARAPIPRPVQAPAGPPPAPLPPIPADCDEYSGNRAIGCALLAEFGFGLDQMPALDALWTRESGWNHQAYNPSSGAYGIPQALPGNKMASAGSDWETNPATQIRWGLGYIRDRYGSPQAAWAFHQANGWY